MNTLERVANNAVKHFSAIEGTEAMVDPATIILFIEIIKEVIVLIKKCKDKPEEGLKTVNRPTIFQRLILRRVVRSNLRMDGANSVDRRYGKSMTEAIIREGEALSLETMANLYVEVDE